MIRDIFHFHDDMKQVTMAYVESEITLYMTFQKTIELPEDFLATFKALIETIKSHGRRSRYHPKLMQDQLAKIYK